MLNNALHNQSVSSTNQTTLPPNLNAHNPSKHSRANHFGAVTWTPTRTQYSSHQTGLTAADARYQGHIVLPPAKGIGQARYPPQSRNFLEDRKSDKPAVQGDSQASLSARSPPTGTQTYQEASGRLQPMTGPAVRQTALYEAQKPELSPAPISSKGCTLSTIYGRPLRKPANSASTNYAMKFKSLQSLIHRPRVRSLPTSRQRFKRCNAWM
ncbi:hypothetical protein PAHA111176_16185 [Parendozoicomonas haliclonae]|uniref:Uncharacterized protein n=1 Tax=Parendozoicomonas haliclonae TaxID=1960125 RepID=A0A1X7AMT7_9GAMM|nr:hypothetical protein EHSB41UT_03367 [Parendozoicomonas haliclonae]